MTDPSLCSDENTAMETLREIVDYFTTPTDNDVYVVLGMLLAAGWTPPLQRKERTPA